MCLSKVQATFPQDDKIRKENLCRFNVSITWQILLYDLLQIFIAVGIHVGYGTKTYVFYDYDVFS